jgi:hypothetical protein
MPKAAPAETGSSPSATLSRSECGRGSPDRPRGMKEPEEHSTKTHYSVYRIALTSGVPN